MCVYIMKYKAKLKNEDYFFILFRMEGKFISKLKNSMRSKTLQLIIFLFEVI